MNLLNTHCHFFQLHRRTGKHPNTDREPDSVQVVAPADTTFAELTKPSSEHETDNILLTKARSVGAITTDMACKLNLGHSQITPAPRETMQTYEKSIDAKRSSNDTILHQSQSQSAVNPKASYSCDKLGKGRVKWFLLGCSIGRQREQKREEVELLPLCNKPNQQFL